MTSYARIRTFRWEDLERYTHLLNEVGGITNTEKAYHPDYMRQFLSQPSFEPEKHCFLAESEDTLVGYMLISPEPPLDRVVASGGVLESHRNAGIGLLLLRAGVEHGRELGASLVHSETPANSAAGHHILESEGFYPVKRFWQMRWTGDELPPVELPDGFAVRPFRLGQDEETLTSLQNEAFGQNWGFSPNTVEQISARVRLSRCDPEGIVFVVEGDRVAGYNWTLRESNEAGSTGWVSMTGVHSEYRGKGLGTAVVLAGMEYLRGEGVEGIELEVDSDNTPARELYLKLGYRTVSQTLWYEKRLK